MGTDTLGVALNSHTEPAEGWEVDRKPSLSMVAWGAQRYDAATRAWINDTISRQVRAGGEVGRFPVIIATHDSAPRFLTYTVMPRLAGDTIIYAAEYETPAFASILDSVLSDGRPAAGDVHEGTSGARAGAAPGDRRTRPHALPVRFGVALGAATTARRSARTSAA